MEPTQSTVENPKTAIASDMEMESEPQSQPSSPKITRVKRHHHKRDKKFVPNFDIPGVHKIVVNEETQEALGCVAGDTVTSEKPWTTVPKDLIEIQLETVASSEFLPIKQEILDFAADEVLVGYIPDETNDFDEFYVCVTDEATAKVNKIIDKLKHIQEERLKNAIHKKIKPWKTLGSEAEVDECILKVSRTLIEVEIESKYPILPFKIQFRSVKCEKLKDGYMALVPVDDIPATIYKKRVHLSIQVTPSMISNEAQTACTYPKNSATQYEYTLPPEFAPSEECTNNIDDYFKKNLNNFCDILQVNGAIDLYLNDYEKLIGDPTFRCKVSFLKYKNYMDFIDMDLCQGKMVASLSWHPMWTGCFVAAYVDTAPNLYLSQRLQGDKVLKAVHDTNPVLFWSFKDDLKPKLILETVRPVYVVSCCPYDENLVIGGCSNGQVIIWDVTNKLQRVEEEEILTVNQQNYRDRMFSLMNWMKNIFDLSVLRPAAISDLKYSHQNCVNAIDWMSPFHQVTKTGKIEELEEGQRSMQFVTCGEDGCVMFWDLVRKPVVAPGGFKTRKLKRLKQRPSALLVEESPYKKLHLNLKPIYKIIVTHNFENQRVLTLSSFLCSFFRTQYEITSKESKRNLRISERFFYRPLLEMYRSNPENKFYVGTMGGDFVEATWDGQEFDSGEVVNWENCQFLNSGRGKYHDGPIVSLDYSPASKAVLSVGGKTFAIWRDDFLDRPVMWRRCTSIYTQGNWYICDNSTLNLIRIDGYMEVWTLFHKSKGPLQTILSANGPINQVSGHPRQLKVSVFGICDYRGAFRVFYSNYLNPLVVEAKEENMSHFLTSEIERKKDFLQWQEDWNKRHVVEIEAKKSEQKIVEIEEKLQKIRKEKKKVKEPSAGERYLETIQDQHKASDQARIRSVILERKQLKTEELLKKREPLNKFEEENEVKKRKQKLKHREADKIFKDTVAMLFPDAIKEKPPPPPNPYEDTYSEVIKKQALKNFHNIAMQAQDYVEENPFSHDFDWKSVLILGKERRKRLIDDSIIETGHKLRYGAIKEAKLAAAKAKSEELSSATSRSRSRSILSVPIIEKIPEAV